MVPMLPAWAHQWLEIAKLLSVAALFSGTLGAFLPESLADRQRAAYWLAGPGFGATWIAGFVLAWARSVVTQCHEAGTKCFVKQLGADPRGNGHDVRPMRVNDDGTPAPSGLRECRLHLRDRKGGDMSEWPEDLRVREFPNTKDTQR